MNLSAIDKSAGAKLTCWLVGLGLGVVVWVIAYSQLAAFADALVGALGLSRATPFGEAVHFFFYDTPKVLLLLTGIVFIMGVIQTFFSPERTRALLSGRREGLGNVLAATLGIVTPFCSCSAVPPVHRLPLGRGAARRDPVFPDLGADGQ